MSFVNLKWFLLSGLRRLTEEEARYGAIKPLSLNNSKTFSLKFSSALLFSIEVSVKVFVISSEIFFIVAVIGSISFLYHIDNLVCLVFQPTYFVLLLMIGCLNLLSLLNLLFVSLHLSNIYIKIKNVSSPEWLL